VRVNQLAKLFGEAGFFDKYKKRINPSQGSRQILSHQMSDWRTHRADGTPTPTSMARQQTALHPPDQIAGNQRGGD
jgi:hypothetical protein